MELLCQEMEKLTKPSNTISDILEQMASLVAPIASKAKIGISGNKEEEEVEEEEEEEEFYGDDDDDDDYYANEDEDFEPDTSEPIR